MCSFWFIWPLLSLLPLFFYLFTYVHISVKPQFFRKWIFSEPTRVNACVYIKGCNSFPFFSSQIKVGHFNGTPIYNKSVYLLEGRSWSSQLLLNLTTDRNGLANFSFNTASLPSSDLHLMVGFKFIIHCITLNEKCALQNKVFGFISRQV